MTLIDIFSLLPLAAFLVCSLLGLGRWRRWSSALLGLAIAIEIVRLVTGQVRWQMAPAYGVLLAGLVVTAGMYRYVLRRWLASHTRVRIAASLAGAMVLALTPLAYWSFPLFELPRPTGSLAVGTTDLHLIDRSRAEVHTASPADRRELMVRVWYPAIVDRRQRPAPYMRDAAAIRRALNERHWPFGWLISHLDQIPTHAHVDAPLAPQQTTYPVLLFSHGLSMGYAGQNTVLCEELASRGYVVLSIDHPYDGLATVFPDGRVAQFLAESWSGSDQPPSADLLRSEQRLRGSLDTRELAALFERRMRELPVETETRRYWYDEWSSDQRFVLDQLERLQSGTYPSRLAGRLALDRIGIFGMSFGGAAAARTCARDSRCKAGINLDGFGDVLIEDPPHRRPFMYMHNSEETANAVFLDRDLDYRYLAQVRGSGHFDFGDAGLLTPLIKLMDGRRDGVAAIDTRRMLALTNAYVTAFFDRHLLDRPSDLLQGPSAAFPEVLFLGRAPAAE